MEALECDNSGTMGGGAVAEGRWCFEVCFLECRGEG